MRVEFTSVNGIPTRFYREGDGYPVVLVHGAGLSADSWIRNIDALGKHFRVIAPDTLGHGYTDSGGYESGPPHPHIVEHLVGLVDQLGIDRFSIVGSSFGALMAALTYFRLPQRVEKLVVISSASAFNTEAEARERQPNAYKNGLAAFTNPTLAACRQRLANVFHDASKIPEELLVMQMTMYAMPGALESYERRFKGMMDIEATRPHRIVNRVEQIKVPALLLWGRQDPRGILARAQEAVRRLPNGKLVVFDRCGHHPHMEYPDAFNELVRQFITEQPLAHAAPQLEFVKV